MRFAIVTHRASVTNLELVSRPLSGRTSVLLSPDDALRVLGPGDVALGRIDVRETLDGVEDGLAALALLAGRGVTVLNQPSALLAAHDKLLTARALERAGLPHPRTALLLPGVVPPALELPCVLKPRYGSWGKDVVLCADRAGLERELLALAARPWFHRHGALVQELVPPLGHDLRLIVAGGEVVGAIRRSAAPNEWRTNVALGARREPAHPSPIAAALALEAARAIGADLVGVDLLPVGPGRYTVLELNGAVDFTAEYAPRSDAFRDALFALARVGTGCTPHAPRLALVV
jgi:RimK family alpha-L-glutamate ligase